MQSGLRQNLLAVHPSAGLSAQMTCSMQIKSLMCMQPGVYDEEGLKRFDLTLAKAAAWNIKIIYTFANYWPDLGGMQW